MQHKSVFSTLLYGREGVSVWKPILFQMRMTQITRIKSMKIRAIRVTASINNQYVGMSYNSLREPSLMTTS